MIKQIADESQEVREETTRQLDKEVVKDWNYQVEFNKRLKENEKIQREVYAYNEKQVKTIQLALKKNNNTSYFEKYKLQSRYYTIIQ